MSSDVESNFESRLQEQLSSRADAFPSKPDRLDVVRAKGRRRQVVSRSVLSLAGVAGVFALIGLASPLFDRPAESTFAVGGPDAAELSESGRLDDDGRADEVESPNALEVDTSDPELQVGDESANLGGQLGGIDQGLPVGGDEPFGSGSFGGTCLPAPALPPVSISDPGKQVVRIASEAELQAAARNLSSNTVLLLAPGTYELSRTLWISVDDVTIRGDSNRCDEVILVGKGMDNAAGDDSVPHGVWSGAANLKVQNLTIRDVYRHSITVNGTGYAPQIYNVRLLNSGQQFVKINPLGFGDGVDEGVVNYAVMKYTDGTPKTDHGGGGGNGYTQGIDLHAGQGWTISNSRFENMHTPDDADRLWNAAVLLWNGASDTTVEANVFVDVTRAIAAGLEGSRARDHSGGVIRNNMIVQSEGLYSAQRAANSDASIIVWNSPGTKVMHNTIYNQGNNRMSIELRFNTDGAEVRNNLIDGPIGHRDDVAYVDTDNVGFDNPAIFRNPALGDLHLRGPVDGITDAAPALTLAGHDFDGHLRNADAAADIGADELVADELPPPEATTTTALSTSTIPTSIRPTTTPRLTTTTRPTTTISIPTRPTTVTTAPASSSTAPPSNELVAKNDFRYQGSFRVPYGNGDETTTLAWGGAGLAYNPANDSLFITGHNWHQLTAEISVPGLSRSSNPSSLPQASFLRTPVDATDGKLPNISSPPENSYGRIGGYLVDGNDLIVSGYDYYDAAGDQSRSHLLTNTNLGASSAMVSIAEDVNARWLGGAMAAIPSEWQGEFGGDTYMTGLAGVPIASNSSVGPAAATFDRALFTGNDSAELVLGYPLADALDGPEAKSNVWNLTSEVRGMVFPEGTSSLLFFGTHGTGEYCYGVGSACGDPVRPYQGTHAYPYRYQVWAYDADDLAKVYRGGAAPESVRPYGVWELDLPYSPETVEIGGVAYDSDSGRIFISQAFADGEQPVVHVYTLR